MTRRLLMGAVAGAAAYAAGCAVLRKLRRYEFDGRTVLITGGSRGLGLLLARRFARLGARVAICARDGDELRRAAEDVSRFGEVMALDCDLADRGAIDRLLQAVRDRWGPIDVLVNNAGVIQVGPPAEMTLQDYDRAMRIHFWAPLHGVRGVLEDMRARKQGRIINIASIGGLISVPHLLPYNASKYALVGLSEGLRAALLKDGIYVTTVCPGLMRTGSSGHAEFKGQNRAEFAWFSVCASTPLLSISADRAADQIIRAAGEGRGHLVLSLPAKLAALIHALAPGPTADALSLTERLLPGPGGIGSRTVKGIDSRPSWLPGVLTRLGDNAAVRNNESGA